MSKDNPQNEPRNPDPLRISNDSAAGAWLRGYADGFNGRDVQEPKAYLIKYLRGYIAGLQAAKRQ